MQKIGFVIPWFGENIPSGAEMELREVTAHLQKAGMEVEILTTCVKESPQTGTRTTTPQGRQW